MTDAPKYPLLDAPEDGAIEERAWVPVAVASSPGDAVAWLRREFPEFTDPIHDDRQTLVPTGRRSWHVEDPCGPCNGTGCDGVWRYQGQPDFAAGPPILVSAPPIIGPDPPCETCSGTGEQSFDRGDVISWTKCAPDVPGAVEFWDLEVVEAGTAAVEEPHDRDDAHEDVEPGAAS
jgi:hypothetical protein